MYKVVSSFRDAKDNNRFYAVGDEYPATNIKLSKSRIEELANGKNRFGRVFIEEVSDGKEDAGNKAKADSGK